MLNKEQHPVYKGLLIKEEQVLKEYKKENNCKWLTFPECIATNGKCWIVLCFIDCSRGFVLFRKKPASSKKIKIRLSNYPIPAEVLFASLLITGLNPVPINEEGEFKQIGGPIKYPTETTPVVKFLYMISDFEEVLKNPDDFVWVKLDLVENIFCENNFFHGDRFDVLLGEIKQIQKDIENLKI